MLDFKTLVVRRKKKQGYLSHIILVIISTYKFCLNCTFDVRRKKKLYDNDGDDYSKTVTSFIEHNAAARGDQNP